jgi:hypothetical protein
MIMENVKRSFFMIAGITSIMLMSVFTVSAQSNDKTVHSLTMIIKGKAVVKLETSGASFLTSQTSGFGVDCSGASHLEFGGVSLKLTRNDGTCRIDIDVEVSSSAKALNLLVTERASGGTISISAGANSSVNTPNDSGRIKVPLD